MCCSCKPSWSSLTLRQCPGSVRNQCFGKCLCWTAHDSQLRESKRYIICRSDLSGSSFHPLDFPRSLSWQTAPDVFSMDTLLLITRSSHNLLLKQNRWSNWDLTLELFSSLGWFWWLFAECPSLSTFFLSSGHQDLYPVLHMVTPASLWDRDSTAPDSPCFVCSFMDCIEMRWSWRTEQLTYLSSSDTTFVSEKYTCGPNLKISSSCVPFPSRDSSPFSKG